MSINQKNISSADWDYILSKIKQYDKSIKIHTILELILTVLDIIFCLITLFYISFAFVFAITSLVCGGVAGSRAMLVLRLGRILEAFKVPATIGIAYVITRKKRSEFMQNIKVRNWVIAILDVVAVVFGIVMVFVQPNAITDNIQAIICGIGALLGVNVAIPCFNNAKKTDEEIALTEEKRAEKQLEKEAKARVKAEQKAQSQELINAEKEKIKNEQQETKEKMENQVTIIDIEQQNS